MLQAYFCFGLPSVLAAECQLYNFVKCLSLSSSPAPVFIREMWLLIGFKTIQKLWGKPCFCNACVSSRHIPLWFANRLFSKKKEKSIFIFGNKLLLYNCRSVLDCKPSCMTLLKVTGINGFPKAYININQYPEVRIQVGLLLPYLQLSFPPFQISHLSFPAAVTKVPISTETSH